MPGISFLDRTSHVSASQACLARARRQRRGSCNELKVLCYQHLSRWELFWQTCSSLWAKKITKQAKSQNHRDDGMILSKFSLIFINIMEENHPGDHYGWSAACGVLLVSSQVGEDKMVMLRVQLSDTSSGVISYTQQHFLMCPDPRQTAWGKQWMGCEFLRWVR